MVSFAPRWPGIVLHLPTRRNTVLLLHFAIFAMVFAFLHADPLLCASLWPEIGVVTRFVASHNFEVTCFRHSAKKNRHVRIRRARVRCRYRWRRAAWPLLLQWRRRCVVEHIWKPVQKRCTTQIRAVLCLLRMLLEVFAYRLSAFYCIARGQGRILAFTTVRKQRVRAVVSSVHAIVLTLIHWYTIGLCYAFDSSLGFPGEGPQNEVCEYVWSLCDAV